MQAGNYSMETGDIIQYRLHNQLLTQSPFSTPIDVVRWFGAMQAQDYYASQWALGIRLPGSTEADIEMALNNGQIIRSWSFRGTWHYMAPEDVQWMLSLVARRLSTLYNSYYRKLELDDKILLKSKKVIIKALEGGKNIGRKDLEKIIREKGISTEGLRSNFILLRAALDGIICQGPRKGKETSFVLAGEWIKKNRKLNREESLLELTKRYFQSHSPASVKDFSWWSGLSTLDAKKGIEMCMGFLDEVKINSSILYFTKNTSAISKVSSNFHLLPAFDEYMVAYNDRNFMIENNRNAKIIPTVFEMLRPGIFDNGILKGNWKRTIKKDKVIVEHTPFAKMNKSDLQSFSKAAEKYSKFLNLHLEFVENGLI